MVLVWAQEPDHALEDDRNYRVLHLPSGLQCLIVIRPSQHSNPNTSTIAYVAAAVAAGSFYDPPEALGLAHLVEHLVFLGSKRYKCANDWKDFCPEMEAFRMHLLKNSRHCTILQ